MPSVTQEWTHRLSMMQQTVLLTAVRGPDNVEKYSPPKMLLRYLRRCTLLSALDGKVLLLPFDKKGEENGGSFTGPSFEEYDLSSQQAIDSFNKLFYSNHEFFATSAGEELTELKAPVEWWIYRLWDEVTAYMKVIDAIPGHFQKHLMHASQILGYKHPDPLIAIFWRAVYLRLVHDLHLYPEPMEDMDRRLGDSREQWLERADLATVK